MTGYFDALLRSAGAVPADAGARAMPASGGDLVEQEFEVEAGTAPEAVAASRPPEAPAQIETAPQTLAETPPQVTAQPREVVRSAPAPSLIARPRLDDEVHPVVRAALQWVAADPGPAERAVPEVAEVRLASDPPPRPLPAATQPTRTLRPEQIRPLSRIERESEPRPERPSEIQPHRSPARELDLSLPHARLEAVAASESPPPAPQDRIEVSIGTIHVSVDAPPAPRAVVQPAPPLQRPQTTRAAPRSGFARSRLPRF